MIINKTLRIFPIFKIIESFGDIKGLDNLLIEKDLQIGLNEPLKTIMKENSSIILDFGKELSGGLRILVAGYSNKPIKLRIRFGESVSETLSDIGADNSTNDHSPRDFYIDTTNLCDLTFGHTGFRFVKIDKITKDEDLIIKSIVAYSEETLKENVGMFKCDDERLNEIYNVASHTVKLCVQNGFVWDGVKRDRLVWIGDLHPEFLSLSCLYNDLTEIRNSLDFVEKQTPMPKWMNDIPMYSLWWTIILHDYYFKTLDKEYLKTKISYLDLLLNQINNCVLDDGNLKFPMNFLDWPTSKDEELIYGVHALTKISLNCISKIYNVLNINNEVIGHISSKLYKFKRNNNLSKKQIIAFDAIANNDYSLDTLNKLVKNRSNGFSTFMSYYILSTIFESNGKKESIELLKEYYGKMLDLGATSFWEDFNIEWAEGASRIDEMPIEGKKDVHRECGDFCYKNFRHSLCHGWSSGPVPFITKYIVGINKPNLSDSELLIKPYLDYLNKVECIYPTIYGDVIIKHNKINGIIDTYVSAPKEINIKFENCEKIKLVLR